ncbi:MAG TPA: Gfo/Idh/MocA family oxidoreductase [Planctomycetota bacterium]|nr:Gfo/Idh/MocA family oxidoreductase [Planctomycetota bacterium]
MSTKVTRRGFLAGLGAGMAAPVVVGSRVLAAPPSDQIRMGHIGIGGQGGGHLGRFCNNDREPTVAVCDVDKGRAEGAAKRCKREVGIYNDFRELLDRKDVDAVVVASPDHWHGLHSMLACEAGKDVFCEKPMMKTIAEGQGMVRAARRFGRVVQIGTQARSTSAGRYAAQYVRNGHIGKVKEVRTWHYNNPASGWEAPQPVPSGLDWDMWVGPAKWVPYHPKRCHFNFRWFLDFGGGQIRDRGAHIFSNICWGMNVDATGPVSVECLSGAAPKGMFDCPNNFTVRYEFKNPDWNLFWCQPGENFGGAGFGFKYFGDKGELVVNGGDGSIQSPKEVYIEPAAGETKLYVSNDHMGDFLKCVRSREKPVMDVAIGHRVTSLCILGNIAFRVGRKLAWDPAKEEIVGDEAANRLLAPPMRPPWHL